MPKQYKLVLLNRKLRMSVDKDMEDATAELQNTSTKDGNCNKSSMNLVRICLSPCSIAKLNSTNQGTGMPVPFVLFYIKRWTNIRECGIISISYKRRITLWIQNSNLPMLRFWKN
jgi:hypothetical protein